VGVNLKKQNSLRNSAITIKSTSFCASEK